MNNQIQKTSLVMLVIFGGVFVNAATAQSPLQTKILATAAQPATDETKEWLWRFNNNGNSRIHQVSSTRSNSFTCIWVHWDYVLGFDQ